MMHAVRNGWKSQTRRPLYSQPATVKNGKLFRADGKEITCPFGVAGDRLWVRERFAFEDGNSGKVIYAADDPRRMRFQQSQFMPRAASRLTLEITATRAERLQQITEADARVEGFDPKLTTPAREWFAHLWDSLAPGEGLMWEDNPFVWVVEFTVMGTAKKVDASCTHSPAPTTKPVETSAIKPAPKPAINAVAKTVVKAVVKTGKGSPARGNRSATDEERAKLVALLKSPPP